MIDGIVLITEFSVQLYAFSDSSPQRLWTNCYNKDREKQAGIKSWFASRGAVAIQGQFAAVGAKGLEAVFVFRRGLRGAWYFFQLLRSSRYEDQVYPDNGRSVMYMLSCAYQLVSDRT